jgi:hypothetical protein
MVLDKVLCFNIAHGFNRGVIIGITSKLKPFLKNAHCRAPFTARGSQILFSKYIVDKGNYLCK